jgi:very-short-patch-repair endonuclease
VISLEEGDPGRRSPHIVRDRLLSEQGYVILRLWRQEVERDLSGAMHRIKAVLEDIAVPDAP